MCPKYVINSEFIFEESPFEQCHASTIVENSDGLVASWFGGSHEGNSDVNIWISRFINETWSRPFIVAKGNYKGGCYPTWNPVLFQYPNGPLMLFYKVGPSVKQSQGVLKLSYDNGKTWFKKSILPRKILGPTKNKPILMDDGRLICPSSTENDSWQIQVEMTRDLGETWSVSKPESNNDYEVIQPTLLQHGHKELQMLARSKNNFIISCYSSNGGRTWGSLQPINLPNPNSGIDAITLDNGLHLLVYNHAKKEKNKWGGARSTLDLAISDDGWNWKKISTLEKDIDGKTGIFELNTETDLQTGNTDFYEREYSYPAIIQGKDGLVHVTYTWKRRRIKHSIINPRNIG